MNHGLTRPMLMMAIKQTENISDAGVGVGDWRSDDRWGNSGKTSSADRRLDKANGPRLLNTISWVPSRCSRRRWLGRDPAVIFVEANKAPHTLFGFAGALPAEFTQPFRALARRAQTQKPINKKTPQRCASGRAKIS